MDKELFKYAKELGLNNFQVTKITTEELTLETLNQNLEKFQTDLIDNFTLSADYEQKHLCLYTQSLNKESINLLKEQAEYIDITIPSSSTKKNDIKDTKTYTISEPTPIVKRLKKLYTLKEKYKTLKEINALYNETIITRTLMTEENTLIDTKKQTTIAFEILVKENDKTSTAYNSKQTITEEELDFESLCQQTIENAVDKLYYREITKGTHQVILTSQVMGKILNYFTDLFSADSIQKGTSLLTGKQNQKIFSDKITIIEDPANPKFLGKRLFDNVGTKTIYKEIVQNGIFKTALYDTKTSAKDNTTPTGNDYGEISVRNLYIKPGDQNLNDLIKKVKEGLLIDNVGGLHAGINPISGDISLQSEGYYIKDGNIKYATKLFVLCTNIMDILNNVEAISNHLEFYLQTTASPDLLINNVKISK